MPYVKTHECNMLSIYMHQGGREDVPMLRCSGVSYIALSAAVFEVYHQLKRGQIALKAARYGARQREARGLRMHFQRRAQCGGMSGIQRVQLNYAGVCLPRQLAVLVQHVCHAARHACCGVVADLSATCPPVMYSQPWSPMPSTTASAPKLRTQKRSSAAPDT